VDAAIFGFAVGTGFALVENLDYLALQPGSALGTWVVRGFGTALMHGGAAASFAVSALATLERGGGRWRWRALLPGYVLAVLLHSAFNHFLAWPLQATLGVVFVLPLVLWAVFARSDRGARRLARPRFRRRRRDARAHQLGAACPTRRSAATCRS